MARISSRELLLDVSRLIWRLWSGRLPTGVDRVCLEYLAHYSARAQAVVQFKGRVFVFGPRDSDRLYALLLDGHEHLRQRLVLFASKALLNVSRNAPRPGMLYLNVGHTGLDRAGLGRWIARNRARAVYLVHDLIPITHPQFCRTGEDSRHRARMLTALSTASGIIGNSQVTLDELGYFAKRESLQMPPAIAAWISGYRPAVEPSPSMLCRPYFVTVGTIEARKNHLLLLKVWERLVATMGAEAPMLVIVGQRGWEAQEAIAMLDELGELAGTVVELARCSDSELEGLLARARALLMPSFAEGFGLPVIEALQAGTPVLASDLPVYREIVGDTPTYVDPLDCQAWEDAIRAFATDTPERDRQKAAMQTFTRPDWESHFAKVDEWLANVTPANGEYLRK
jgi:glycosyltransferase involved in cell wall biosynthesis